jgi:hypothetical protein
MHDSNFVTVVFQRPRQMSRQFDFVLDYENSHELEFTIVPDEARDHTRTTRATGTMTGHFQNLKSVPTKFRLVSRR